MAKEILIDPWGAVLIEDYRRVIDEFGLQPLDDDLLKKLSSPNKLMRRKVVFCHRDLDVIVEAMRRGEEFYALTGITTSAEKLHLGNRMIIENMCYFQQRGAKTFLLIADIETAVIRGIDLEESRRRALEFHVPSYLALGIDPDKTIFYFQSENRAVMRLALTLSRRITLSEFKAIYGSIGSGKIIASLLDVSDILYPQLEEPTLGIIPVAIDQDPHLRLARDVAHRTRKEYGFVAPASIYTKFTPSLDGTIKMSKSKPHSCIEIPEDRKSVEEKIMDAFTGGRETLELQRKFGGRPEICMVFELFKQHLIEEDQKLDEIYQSCKSGALACGECKTAAAQLMGDLMEEFEQKLDEARGLVSDLTFVE